MPENAFNVWIGIDVSKKTLDVTRRMREGKPSHRRFSNAPDGWNELLAWLGEDSDQAHFVMESTGAYSYGIASHLADRSLRVSVENPRFIKRWSQGMRYVNKTDRADSGIIAHYAQEVSPPLWALTDPRLREIHLLLGRVDDLGKQETAERNRLENPHLPRSVTDSIQRSTGRIREERESVLKELERCLSLRPDLCEKLAVLVCEPGVGELTALRILSFLGWDADRFNSAQQAAAAAGLNPVRRESGTWKGKTMISKSGPSEIRGALHMAAIVAITHNPKIRAFYERLLKAGKSKLAAVTACARKLLMMLFGMLKAHQKGKTIVYSGPKLRYTALRRMQKTLPKPMN